MMQQPVMNVCFRWLDKARICEANPPERKLCGCLIASLFNGHVCLQIRAWSCRRHRETFIAGCSTDTKSLIQTGPGHHEGTSGVFVKLPLPVSLAARPRALLSQRSHKPSTAGYSIISEAFTQTGPNHHEGTY